MPPSDERRLAVWTLHCEKLCMLLTVSYSALILHDIWSEPQQRYTDPSWFENGFCIAWETSYFNSHYLCFVADVLCGSALAAFNLSYFRATRDSRVLPALAVGVFDALHGVGHLMIGLIGIEAVAGREALRGRGPVLWLLQYVIMACFLSIGPFVAHQVNKMRRPMCIVLHLLSIALFVQFVPVQFAFAAVNLFLNSWYCLPRILFFGAEAQSDIDVRTKDGYAVVSIGLLLVMLIVYAECLACDAFVRAWSGHLLYDCSILFVCIWYTYDLCGGDVKLALTKAIQDDLIPL